LESITHLLIHQRKTKAIRMELVGTLQTKQFEKFERVLTVKEINNPISGFDLLVKTEKKMVKVRSGTKSLNPKAEFCLIRIREVGLLKVFQSVLASRSHFQIAQSANRNHEKL
jgi:hypothetical protein